MPRKKKECSVDDCCNITHGDKCSQHNYDSRRIYTEKGQASRASTLHKKYNIDLMGFDVLWQAFKGRCGICNNQLKMPEKRQGQSLDVVAIDHDHVTGNIRGLLCNACNKGLGFFKDNPTLLMKAMEWVNHD
jgi:hypothetical protein